MVNVRGGLLGWFLYFYGTVVQRTCRFQVDGIENLQTLINEDLSIIIASWHGQQMMIVDFLAQRVDATRFMIIVPDDWRGRGLEIWARLEKWSSFKMDLTGDSTMTSGRQLLEMVRHIRNGNSVFINPDGPTGPAFQIKPGVAFMAKKGGAMILPVGGYARHPYKLNRWDQYVAPMPFSRISLYFGEAFEVPKDADDLEFYTEKLTDLINRATAKAAANYYAGA